MPSLNPDNDNRNTTLHIQHAVATITLNRPAVRNAFNEATIAELTQTFTAVGRRSDVRCVVLAATGTAFCAGADLHWMRRMADYSQAENMTDAAQLAEMLHVLYACPKPTIARIHGDVFAGGLGLVAACDIAVSTDTAHYCLSEVKIGLIPATISPYVLRAIGPRAAQRYCLTAERFNAAEALRIGLVHQVVAVDQLDSAVTGLTQSLISAGPAALASCKQLLHDVAGHALDSALIAHTVQGIASIRASIEGREGVQAFLQKRKPNWWL